MAKSGCLKQEQTTVSSGNQTHMLHVWYIYLQNWVILFGQMLGFIFQHHGAYGKRGLNEIPILVGGFRWENHRTKRI